MVSAGRLCLRFFANAEALSLARKGLQLCAQLPAADRVCLKIEFHDIMLAAAPLSDWEEAARRYVELAEEALDTAQARRINSPRTAKKPGILGTKLGRNRPGARVNPYVRPESARPPAQGCAARR